MIHRYIKPHYAPSSAILAIMTRRGSTEPVAALAISEECILKAADVAVLRGEFQFSYERMVKLHAGQTVYFVAEPACPGWSYLVFTRMDGSFACTCKESRNGNGCEHTGAVSDHCRTLAQKQNIEAAVAATAATEQPAPTTDEPATAAPGEPGAAVVEAERIIASRRRYTEQTVANLTARTELKNGTVLYEFASTTQPGYTYFITAKDGSIDYDTHKDCEGYLPRFTCAHVDMVRALEEPNHAVSWARNELSYRSVAHRPPYIEAARRKLVQAEEVARAVYALPLAEQLERAKREAPYALAKRMEKYIVV